VGAEHDRLGPVVQTILDGGEGRHNAGVVRDLPLLLWYVEVAPARTHKVNKCPWHRHRNFNKSPEKGCHGLSTGTEYHFLNLRYRIIIADASKFPNKNFYTYSGVKIPSKCRHILTYRPVPVSNLNDFEDTGVSCAFSLFFPDLEKNNNSTVCVADPDPVYHYDADPDPDPDPTFQFDADLVPDPQHWPKSYQRKILLGSRVNAFKRLYIN
jgi:hypothetical protein